MGLRRARAGGKAGQRRPRSGVQVRRWQALACRRLSKSNQEMQWLAESRRRDALATQGEKVMTEHATIADTQQGARFEDLPKLIVRRQLNRSGNALIAAIEPLKDDEFFKGGPSGISAAWTVGHLACVHDLFGSALDDGKLAFSPEAHSAFNDLAIGDHKFATRAE